MSWSEEDRELLEGFVAESREALDSINPLFVEVVEVIHAGKIVGAESLNAIFRLFHTMKGSAGFLNLNTLVEVNHEAETLLDICRKEPELLDAQYIEILLSSCDIISQLIDAIELTGTDDGHLDTSEILNSLKSSQNRILNKEEPAESDSGDITSSNELTGDEITLEFSLLSPEILEKFVQEGLDLLDSAEADLLAFSKNYSESAVLGSAFRSIHTFKGNCGLMSFADMQKISHGIEAVLEGLKDGRVSPEEEKINVLLNSIDTMREGLIGLMQGKQGEIEELSAVLPLLEKMKPLDKPLSKPVNTETVEINTNVASKILLVEDDRSTQELINKILTKKGLACFPCDSAEEALEILNSGQKIDVCLTDIYLPKMSGEEFISHVNAHFHSIPVIALSGNKDRDLLKDLMKLEVYGFADKPVNRRELLELVENAIGHLVRKQFQAGSSADETKENSKVKVRQDIRVDLHKLDTLIDLVGELIIAEAMVTRHPDIDSIESQDFERATHRLHLITNELQDIAMAVRMVPVSATFKKMMRLVHDISNKIGKPLKLLINGEDTEVDKAVVDMIADPLVHMIRNSADHGIESPEDRIKAGKDEQGVISLDAVQKASEVLIIISDDGRGLNREKILEKSKANGLVQDDGENLSDSEVYQLIFEPGFSTAQEVTDISGRGVGMDVVKKNIEKIKGRIEINNNPGKGCSFIIHIPLTLATIEGMLAKVGKTKYTVPIADIRESLRPSKSQITVRPDGQEFVKIRESLLPVFRLHELHNIQPQHKDLDQGILMVLDLLQGPICLFVDDILHQVQTVIKHLSGYMGDIKGISGCNILGNGEVALILDPETAMKCIPVKRSMNEAI
ncbi:MAG: chemotaxis protein CheA [Lentisphaeraceae bacterium]|nr:chemotaxis protein CheA [Lentisphaeraceae bacterium]